MAHGPSHYLDQLTPKQLHAQAQSYRHAAQAGVSEHAKAGFIRLAERFEEMVAAVEAKVGRPAEGGDKVEQLARTSPVWMQRDTPILR